VPDSTGAVTACPADRLTGTRVQTVITLETGGGKAESATRPHHAARKRANTTWRIRQSYTADRDRCFFTGGASSVG